MFDDRLDAAAQLAQALRSYEDSHPLILAIPRGAVPIGAVLARRLRGDLDLVMVRKLRAPGADEFAVGATMIAALHAVRARLPEFISAFARAYPGPG
jgi:predicted phosphoribosyltransferase